MDADFHVPTILGARFRTHGFSLQTSLRYDIPLKPHLNFLHEVTWGFDFKRTNNNLDLGESLSSQKIMSTLPSFNLDIILAIRLPLFPFPLKLKGFVLLESGSLIKQMPITTLCVPLQKISTFMHEQHSP